MTLSSYQLSECFSNEIRRPPLAPHRLEPHGAPEAGCSIVGARDGDVLPETEGQGRMANPDWCRCQRCKNPLRKEDCLCCAESPAALSLRGSRECVRWHEDFDAVCFHISVLRVALTVYREFRNAKTDISLNRSVLKQQTMVLGRTCHRSLLYIWFALRKDRFVSQLIARTHGGRTLILAKATDK